MVFREFVAELLATQGVDAPDGERAHAGRGGRGGRAGRPPGPPLPLRGAPPLTRFGLWVATHECTLDDRRARDELGYAPVISRDRGLARAARRAQSSGRPRARRGPSSAAQRPVLLEADLRLEQERQRVHRRARLALEPPQVGALRPRALVLG